MLTNIDRDQRQEIRKKLGWHGNEIVGIYIGTAYLRHLDQLFEGWGATRSKNPSIRLVIIGDAIRQKQLSHFVRAANSSLTFHPSMPPEQLWPILMAADFGVAYVPNTPGFSHQQSTKILEYVAAGLPVLATSTPANMRFIEDGKNGWLIDDTPKGVAVGLEKMLHWLPTFRKESLGNQSLAREYAWPRIVQQRILPIYRSIT
ncbi:MAG: glycosyltransferase [Patescibacteria group bacterium]